MPPTDLLSRHTLPSRYRRISINDTRRDSRKLLDDASQLLNEAKHQNTLPSRYWRIDINDTRRDSRKLLYDASQLLNKAKMATHLILGEISTKSRDLIKPSDVTFHGIRPALRILSSARCVDVCRAILHEKQDEGWSEDELAEFKEWNVDGENLVLFALGAMLRTGVVTQLDGRWKITDFGRQIEIFWMLFSPLDAMNNLWSDRMRVAHLDALHWAWETLSVPQIRPLLEEMLASTDGFAHDQLPTNDFERKDVLPVVAAAAAIGAIWFTGWRWEATLYGSWLINHPDSTLRKR